MQIRRLLPLLILGGAAVVAATTGARAQSATYLALGDSLAYGFDTITTTPRSAGDRGYVRLYADWLGAATGERPAIVNLGVPGETTGTFFLGGSLGYLFNSNYSLSDPPTQAALLEESITRELAAGRDIATVSLHIGVNDFFEVTERAGFEDLPPADQRALVDAEIPLVAARYADILTRICSRLPASELIVLGYYDPYAALPESPLHEIAPYGAQAINAMIQSQAARFGGRYIDLYTPFLGHEAEWTLILSGGEIHPNAAGYAAIAGLMVPRCPCEFTGDAPAVVDIFDLLRYLEAWFGAAPAADLDGGGAVDVTDLLAYLDCWFGASVGAACP